MLMIREIEIRELTERMESMDVKFKAEKDREKFNGEEDAAKRSANVRLKGGA